MSSYLVRVSTKDAKGRTFTGFYNSHSDGPYYDKNEATFLADLDEAVGIVDHLKTPNRDDGEPGSLLVRKLPGLSEQTSPMTVHAQVINVVDDLKVSHSLHVVVGYTVSEAVNKIKAIKKRALAKLTLEERKALGL